MKYIFSINILFLVLAGIALLTNHNGLAEKITWIIFWVMVLGTFLYIKEMRG